MHLSFRFLQVRENITEKRQTWKKNQEKIPQEKGVNPKWSIRLIFQPAIAVWILHWAFTKPCRQPTPSSQFIFLMTAFNDREIWCLKPSHLCGLFPQIPYFPSTMPPQKSLLTRSNQMGGYQILSSNQVLLKIKKLHCYLVTSWSSKVQVLPLPPNSYWSKLGNIRTKLPVFC